MPVNKALISLYRETELWLCSRLGKLGLLDEAACSRIRNIILQEEAFDGSLCRPQ